METWGGIILGWLLGMLSPIIVGRVKRKYSKKDIHQGILSELDSVQERMILTADMLGEGHGKYDKEFVQWCIKRLGTIKSPNLDIISNWKSQLLLRNEEFEVLRSELLKKGNSGKSLKRIELLFYDLHISDLSLFSTKFQGHLVGLRTRISFYNDEVKKAENYLLMTFDSSITGVNHQTIKEQLADKYRMLQDLCVQISDQIDAIKNENKI